MNREALYDLLEQAWAQPEDERRAWLARHCADPEMLAEAESLLEADTESGAFLGESAMVRAAAMLAASEGLVDDAQQCIGKYRIVKPIARGGMGDVYLGERADGDFEQKVAIKLAQRFQDTADRRRRFLEEQRILARLEHPNIARLIDGGIWEGDALAAEGRPYLVMEFVDGRPISEYCEAEGAGLKRRLALFQKVCDAVHYAHRNLVLHRDLKPSNILVSAEGRVKLLDFGIATVLEEDVEAARTRTMIMTPDYAAPEQLRGDPLTTSTDVYALGKVLAELVGEARPRDLDTIIGKALADEPERRYPSARSLAEDLQNFLDGKPVQARPDSRRYRIGKFISRHRWETVTATVAVLALMVATVVAIVSAAEARRALERSQVEAAKSAQVVDFLGELFAAANPEQTGGEAMTVREVLDAGAAQIDALSDQPEVQGLLLSELGGIHRALGEYETATVMLERAADLQRSTLGSNHPALAETLHRWAIAEDLGGDLAVAEAVAREALEIRQAVVPRDEAAFGESLDRLGAVIAVQGRYEEAAPLAHEAVERLVASAGEADERTLTALHNLAWLQKRLGDLEGSAETYRRVARLSEQAMGDNHPETLISRDALAVTLRQQGRLDEAEAIYRDVLERRLKVLGPEHDSVGSTRHNLARLLAERGRYAEAISMYEETIANWSVSLGPEHPHLGIAYGNLGSAREEHGDHEGALADYQRAIDILDGEPGYESRLQEAAEGLERVTGQIVEGDKGKTADRSLTRN